MDLSTYQRIARETSGLDLGGPQSATAPILGLASEAGAVLNIYRKYIRQGLICRRGACCYRPVDVIHWMVDNQERELERLGLPFNGLYGRPLHAIDCQGLFCETDKYCREAAPELASARKRIKARFTRSTEPLAFFFPPKWGLNDRIANSAPQTREASAARPVQAALFSLS